MRGAGTGLGLGPLLLIAACLGDSDIPLDGSPERARPLDPSRMVAIGDGFLAGAQDDALYGSGQTFSVPSLLGGLVGAEDFVQPLIADPGFALAEEEGGRLRLVSAFPPVIERLPRGGPPLLPDLGRPYNNLGVPGALAAEALSARSGATSITGNPFYDLVLRDRGTFAEQAAELDATLALVWLGTTDVLVYATAGGDEALAPGLPTSPASFAGILEALLDQVREVTAAGAVFNVPDVTRFASFHAVPTVVIDPLTGEPVLITIFERVVNPMTGDTVTVQRQVPVPLIGPDGPLGPGDLVTMKADSLIEEGIGIPVELNGSGEPLPDRVVLDVGEQFLAREAVDGYNLALGRLAAERGFALVDVHALVEELAEDGIVSDGVLLTTAWLTGQAFSLDGATLTPKGYGLVTNALVDALNERYGTRLPHVRTATLPGVPLLTAGR
ncbi:MAG: hypothetical protein ACREK5_03065 [Gemmatimonadota bacterium]